MEQVLQSLQNQTHSADSTVPNNLVWFSDVTGVICTWMLPLAICPKMEQKDPPRLCSAAVMFQGLVALASQGFMKALAWTYYTA